MTAETPKNQNPVFAIIDGHAMAHRAYHAIPENMQTASGEHTNAVYGFATMLLRILRDQKPNYIAVAFDLPAPTFRHKAFDQYKAQRPAMPEQMKAQFQRIRQLVAALNIPVFEREEFEADDVIGTLTVQAAKQQVDSLIITGDMDTLQLVNEHVRVQAAKKSVTETMIYDIHNVEERFGVAPAQIPDWKGLAGDSSDNIPGVPGIGSKTATQLLLTYGTLENTLEHVKELPNRQKDLLTQFGEQARRCKWLATIKTDIPLQLNLSECVTHDFQPANIITLFKELEFQSLLNRYSSVVHAAFRHTEREETMKYQKAFPVQGDLFATPAPVTAPEPSLNTEEHTDTETVIVNTPELLQSCADALRRAGRFALDTETTGADPLIADLVGISLAVEYGKAWYIPIGHTNPLSGARIAEQCSLEDAQTYLGPVFRDTAIKKICHNAKFDMMVLRHNHLPVEGLQMDTMVAAYLCDPGSRELGLKKLAPQLLQAQMSPIQELIGSGAKQITMDLVPVEKAAPYAGRDADMTLQLAAPLQQKLEELQVSELLYQLEMPLIAVLERMEEAGVLLDRPLLDQMSIESAEQIAVLEKAIYASVGHEFNINSPKQLGEILFEELRLPKGKKTKTGYSVDADTLETLQGAHPMVDLLLEYRGIAKLRSVYIDGMRELMHQSDGRIHTSFNQTVASSGRLSSSNPNLQNIPIRTEAGRQIRRAFIAAPNHMLLTADYAQIELRILAHITKDESLIAAFRRNEDIHKITGSRLYGIPAEEITGAQRRMAKTVTYAIMYGQSAFGLAKTAGLSRAEAKNFIEAFEAGFSGIKEYEETTLAKARREGYVQTLFGRKRFFRDILDLPQHMRQAAEREAINMPIQGSNADIIKIAMIQLDESLQQLHLKSKMILQVHDELVFEVPDDELPVMRKLVREKMEGAAELSVPLRVEIKIGRNWYSAEAAADE